jgi:hypothetical protein
MSDERQVGQSQQRENQCIDNVHESISSWEAIP